MLIAVSTRHLTRLIWGSKLSQCLAFLPRAFSSRSKNVDMKGPKQTSPGARRGPRGSYTAAAPVHVKTVMIAI